MADCYSSVNILINNMSNNKKLFTYNNQQIEECKTQSLEYVHDDYNIFINYNPVRRLSVEEKGIYCRVNITNNKKNNPFTKAIDIFFPHDLDKYYSQWNSELIVKFVLEFYLNFKQNNKNSLTNATINVTDFTIGSDPEMKTIKISYNAEIVAFDVNGYNSKQGSTKLPMVFETNTEGSTKLPRKSRIDSGGSTVFDDDLYRMVFTKRMNISGTTILPARD